MVDGVDERTGPLHVDVDAEEANVGPTQEDPVVAFQRARRRKRQKWWLGLAALAVGGAAWAVHVYWPLPTSHIRVELDVTCPMKVGGRVFGDHDRIIDLPSLTASPAPDGPGQTVVFDLDGAPDSHVGIHARLPVKRWSNERDCHRAACRIFADGELVFEGLSTASRSIRCDASTKNRSPWPALSHPFPDLRTVPLYDDEH